jgi:signal recognition particle GTPase
VTELVREVKKWKALKKLWEHVEKEPDRELRWAELRNILASAEISLTYAEKLIPELEMYGILSKFQRHGKIYYRVNVERLRKVVKILK